MKMVVCSEADPAARRIMVRAGDDHIIAPYDSIDVACTSHRGVVMAPALACNTLNAVGQLAGEFNQRGNQVWKPQWMKEAA